MSTLQVHASAMTQEEAERVSLRIALKLDAAADSWNGAIELIRDALARDAYRALGYPSHGAYVADRFGGALAKLGVELRREVVRELTDAGLSTRAIAPVFEVSAMTVSNDLKAGVKSFTPEAAADHEPPATPEQLARIKRQREEFPTPGRAVYSDEMSGRFIIDDSGDSEGFCEAIEHAEPLAEQAEQHVEPEPAKTVTGLDGKTYKRPEPVAPRRKSIVDEARNANFDLWKAVERIRSIKNDDRFNKNKADIQAALQPAVDLANEILADLANPEGN